MTPDRRQLLGLAAGLAASPAATRLQAEPTSLDPAEVWPLWPDGAPGGEAVTVTPVIIERSTDPGYHDRIARYTTSPDLLVVRAERPNGAGLLLIPGGGYRWSVIDKEGLDCARVFAAVGITCFVLKYRLPADGWAAGPDAPLQDAQRAMRLIRARSGTVSVDPDRIGVLGASAGGHLAGLLLARRDATYPSLDAADRLSFRADIGLLLYPVSTMSDPFAHAGSRRELLGPSPSAETLETWSLDCLDWTGAPPVWLAHAIDDRAVPVENALGLLAALRRDKVPCEAHLFEEGGHGFGIRLIAGRPASAWPQAALAFGRRHPWLAADSVGPGQTPAVGPQGLSV